MSKFLALLLGAFLFSSCTLFCKPQVRYMEKAVFVKCKIPDVPKADLKPIPSNATYPKKLEIILNNYLKLEKENKLLREAIKVCQ